jgi:hypothetical protein
VTSPSSFRLRRVRRPPGPSAAYSQKLRAEINRPKGAETPTGERGRGSRLLGGRLSLDRDHLGMSSPRSAPVAVAPRAPEALAPSPGRAARTAAGRWAFRWGCRASGRACGYNSSGEIELYPTVGCPNIELACPAWLEIRRARRGPGSLLSRGTSHLPHQLRLNRNRLGVIASKRGVGE